MTWYEDVIEFLTARLDEDEAAAKLAADLAWAEDPATAWFTAEAPSGEPIVAAWPARALADVAAKRALITRQGAPQMVVMGWILRNMLSAYADHPDYNPAWALPAST